MCAVDATLQLRNETKRVYVHVQSFTCQTVGQHLVLISILRFDHTILSILRWNAEYAIRQQCVVYVVVLLIHRNTRSHTIPFHVPCVSQSTHTLVCMCARTYRTDDWTYVHKTNKMLKKKTCFFVYTRDQGCTNHRICLNNLHSILLVFSATIWIDVRWFRVQAFVSALRSERISRLHAFISSRTFSVGCTADRNTTEEPIALLTFSHFGIYVKQKFTSRNAPPFNIHTLHMQWWHFSSTSNFFPSRFAQL